MTHRPSGQRVNAADIVADRAGMSFGCLSMARSTCVSPWPVAGLATG
jgi:hypothetical protein